MADPEPKKDEPQGPGLVTIFFVSLAGGLAAAGVIAGVKYAIDRGRDRRPALQLYQSENDPSAWEWAQP